MVQKCLIGAVFIFYGICVTYLFLGLVHIGFPSIEKAEVIKGLFSFTSTVVSLFVAYLAYKAANKAATATENAAESNRLAVSIAEQSLFNTTFERRLSVYKAMWELNGVLESIDRYIGVNRKEPEQNYVSKELYEKLLTFRDALVFESKVLPDQLQNKISHFYVDVRHEISCQLMPKEVKDELCPEIDSELFERIKLWKQKNHERNLEIKGLLTELSPYLKAP
ncbi:hypothetical protein WM008_23210 [Vibrio vulnificus]|uniref:hypothetical protein n=1 Tax=Vibrio TaxID=662 RepID=UPI001A297FDD|nr:hypothetical protein [Vibrio cholerae]EGQ9992297.1 hypothetical protein [Vibrio vulnificus]EGR0063659.1 hypothetical protein [Vibrio vulnificus]EGR0637590.1 hypothetical protein [Vibrio vulnificus]EIJ0948487.1 hypothetical protein [Vibrio vulnificus]EIJ0971315.1 hypothetical protein [Vibrio vulnificus]